MSITKEQIETTMKIHFNTWNNEQQDEWLDNWTDDVVMFDPVGGPDKNGKIAETYSSLTNPMSKKVVSKIESLLKD